MIHKAVRRIREFAFPLYCGLLPIRFEDLVAVPEFQVRFQDLEADLGAGSMWDLTAVAALAATAQPRRCFEIGTGHGRTTLHLALNTAPDTEIYTLDISNEPPIGSAFRDHPVAEKITRITGNSRDFDFSSWNGQIDLVFIDGAHDYESVCCDTAAAFSLASERGTIIWDDFTPGWPGVVKALKTSPWRSRIKRIPGTKLAVSVPVTAGRVV